MQALFDLVHTMAKEEKRLYHLHGREGRFTHIYKGYLQSETYSKELDRQIYQKHFATFSKAFYSMQKNALLDDILAVLLEYSNSAKDDFTVFRLRAKSDVLSYRGFADPALNYLRSALEAAAKGHDPKLTLRLLEDYRDALSKSDHASFDEYQSILDRIVEARNAVAKRAPIEEAQQKLSVIIATAKQEGNAPTYKSRAWAAVEVLQELAAEAHEPEAVTAAFDAEFRYALAFEDPIARHKRLVQAERNNSKGFHPRPLRLRIVNLLLQSSMDCGDFLLINGIIYKTNKEIPSLSAEEKSSFLPKYLELCSFYHFYENELPTAQQELAHLIGLPNQSEEELFRHRADKVAFCIAANMPKSAGEALDELFAAHADGKQDLHVKLMELMIAVESNRRDEALVLVQRLRVLLRKAPDARKQAHFRLFLELVQKMLSKKRVQWQDIPGFHMNWTQPLKPNLWLKAKMENKFYYNFILDDWQARKKILNV